MSDVSIIDSGEIGVPFETDFSEISEQDRKAQLIANEVEVSSEKQAEIIKEDFQKDIILEQSIEEVANKAAEIVESRIKEIVEKTLEEEIQSIANKAAEIVQEAPDKAAEIVQEAPDKAAEIVQEAPDKAAEIVDDKIQDVTLKNFPTANLQKISLGDLKKRDTLLVKTHAKDEKAIKSIKWDKARNVVVIEKNGKFRVYRIGSGKSPAIFESAKKSHMIAYLNRM